ncbi:hypothetical protein, partial [Fibrobacter intestinalis]|uniref:hypothetical protein n=1 Tax=Fibrobacter intestinalis TaxID=28122 RepID=UPI0023F5514C
DLPDRRVSRNVFHSILPNFKRNVLFRSRSGTGLRRFHKKRIHDTLGIQYAHAKTGRACVRISEYPLILSF